MTYEHKRYCTHPIAVAYFRGKVLEKGAKMVGMTNEEFYDQLRNVGFIHMQPLKETSRERMRRDFAVGAYISGFGLKTIANACEVSEASVSADLAFRGTPRRMCDMSFFMYKLMVADLICDRSSVVLEENYGISPSQAESIKKKWDDGRHVPDIYGRYVNIYIDCDVE